AASPQSSAAKAPKQQTKPLLRQHRFRTRLSSQPTYRLTSFALDLRQIHATNSRHIPFATNSGSLLASRQVQVDRCPCHSCFAFLLAPRHNAALAWSPRPVPLSRRHGDGRNKSGFATAPSGSLGGAFSFSAGSGGTVGPSKNHECSDSLTHG